MLFLLAMGSGLFFFGRRSVSARMTDNDRKMRIGNLFKEMTRWEQERIMPVIGGLTLEACGLLMICSAVTTLIFS